MVLLIVAPNLSCGNGGGAVAIDALASWDASELVDAGPFVDAGPPPRCGCPEGPGPCFSGNVFEWTDRTPVGPTDGLTVYVVRQTDYSQHAAPLAVAVPDADGRVIFEGMTETGDAYIVLDDASDTGMDRWSHTGVGPVTLPGAGECVDMPALLRAHGDAFLTEVGYPPGGPAVNGLVIVEVRDQYRALRELVELQMAPAPVIQSYFTADRQHVDPYLGSTTTAGALLSFPSTYCSQLCQNITCSCGVPLCGEQIASEQGGADNGFLFATMACYR